MLNPMARVGEAVPFAGDVGHLELEFRGGKPGIGSLRPEITQLDLALPGRLLLLLPYSATATPARLLEVVLISYSKSFFVLTFKRYRK